MPQLLTNQPGPFLQAAEKLKELGYQEVNLNLGCPSGTVTAKGKGSGFLAHPDKLRAFLDEVFEKTPITVSIKTRLGMDDPEEFGPLLELYRQYPIGELTVHPRVRADLYRRPVRMGYFEKALAECPFPVALSGGVFQNRLLLELTVELLEQMKFRVLTHHLVPPNDGGIALGQAVYGLKRLKLQKNET